MRLGGGSRFRSDPAEGGIDVENPFAKLRFDISEKVCLHPQQPGIDTLLEMDLYPDVEIKDEGQHLKIQGYLRLNGTYLAERQTSEDSEEGGVHTNFPNDEVQRLELAYVIPVEITLPADRAEHERILAEVESFDYSLLSPFELQIEAVLVIDGLIPEKTEAEEFSEAEEFPAAPVFSGAPARPLSIRNDMEEERDEPDSHGEDGTGEFGHPPDFDGYLEKEHAGETALPEFLRKEEWPDQAEQESSPSWLDREEPNDPTRFQHPGEFWRERQDSKLEQRWEDRQEPVSEPAEGMESAQREEPGFTGNDKDRRQQAEWIHWLVGNKSERFTPIRMVIVQKDETIDQLANRYEVSANQLIRLNRLKTDRLEEGQILHVPCPNPNAP
jgi:stage VI sporulation protein D